MRVSYIADDPKMSSPEDQAVVDSIKERRGGTLLSLDKALLHAPAIAGGYSAFLKAVRTQNSLPDSIRELCMCRVATLNSAWFEWESHAPLLVKAGVLDQQAVESLKDTSRTPGEKDGLDERHAAVCAYTDAMTKGVLVKDAVFAKVKGLFSEKEVVEITVCAEAASVRFLLACADSLVCKTTIAAYNCVSRFLVALDVSEMSSKYGISME